MPAAYVKTMAKKAGISIEEAEKKWDKAKELTKAQGIKEQDDKFYPIVASIFKKMMKKDKTETSVVATSGGAAKSADRIVYMRKLKTICPKAYDFAMNIFHKDSASPDELSKMSDMIDACGGWTMKEQFLNRMKSKRLTSNA